VAAPTLQELVGAARLKIRQSKAKPRQRRALSSDLETLYRKVLKAKSPKEKKKAEASLRTFIKKHKLA
jgi:hypothetical protein